MRWWMIPWVIGCGLLLADSARAQACMECDRAMDTDGWCEACDVGYIDGIPRMCRGCHTAEKIDGWCGVHEMAFFHGRWTRCRACHELMVAGEGWCGDCAIGWRGTTPVYCPDCYADGDDCRACRRLFRPMRGTWVGKPVADGTDTWILTIERDWRLSLVIEDSRLPVPLEPFELDAHPFRDGDGALRLYLSYGPDDLFVFVLRLQDEDRLLLDDTSGTVFTLRRR